MRTSFKDLLGWPLRELPQELGIAWEIPRPLPANTSKKRPSRVQFHKSIRDALQFSMLCMRAWLRAKEPELTLLDANRSIHVDLDARRRERLKTFRQEPDRRRKQGKAAQKGTLAGTPDPINPEDVPDLHISDIVRGKMTLARKIIAERTPFETEDELTEWFKQPYLLAKGDTEHENIKRDQQIKREQIQYFDIIDALDRAAYRADELAKRLNAVNAEIARQLTPDPGYLRPLVPMAAHSSDEHVANLLEFFAEPCAYTPTLYDCFIVSHAAWINASDLWPQYVPYSPILEVAALVGRLSCGFPVHLNPWQLGLLLQLVAEPSKLDRFEPKLYLARLNGLPVPPQRSDELESDHQRIRDSLQKLFLILIKPCVANKAVEAWDNWRAFDLEPRRLSVNMRRIKLPAFQNKVAEVFRKGPDRSRRAARR